MLGVIPTYVERTDVQTSFRAPASFDARTKWPNCFWPVRDQGQCGSCWAHGLSESFSVRQCSMGGNAVELSPQDAISCDKVNYGWQGGYIDKAWNYVLQTGLVTDKWFPYVSGSGRVPACPTTCPGTGEWKKYKCKSGSIFNKGGNKDAMK